MIYIRLTLANKILSQEFFNRSPTKFTEEEKINIKGGITMEEMVKEILITLKEFKEEERTRWEENDKRWEQNERRWEENERRWEKNERRWEENDKRWEKNEKRWQEAEKRLSNLESGFSKLESGQEGAKNDFFRFFDIVDKNFQKVFKDIENLQEDMKQVKAVLPTKEEKERLEARLRRIEENQEYFEEILEMHEKDICVLRLYILRNKPKNKIKKRKNQRTNIYKFPQKV